MSLKDQIQADLGYITKMDGVPLVYNGVSGFGILNTSEEVVMMYQNMVGVIGKSILVDIPASTFTGLATGHLITVDGTVYTIKDRRLAEQGAIERVLCAVK